MNCWFCGFVSIVNNAIQWRYLTKWFCVEFIRHYSRFLVKSSFIDITQLRLIKNSTRTCAYQGVRNVTFSGNFAYALNEWSLNMVHGLTSPDLIREIYWNKIANDLSKFVKNFHSKHLKILKSNIKTFLFLFATFSFFCFYFKFVLFVTFKINWTTWLKCINFCIWFSKAINPLNKHCTKNEVFD